MADYILDIDTKFLQNLKAADAALAKSIANSKMISTQFSNMVQRSQAFGKSLGNVQTAMSKLGSGATVDFSKGIISINSAAMTATDKVNLLTKSVQQLRTKYDELQASTSKKGMALKSSADLTDKAKVEAALRQAENKLDKGTSPAKSEHLRKQVELYKAAMKELTKSDDQRTKEAVREVQRRVAEANKEADSKIKQSERETNAIRKNHEKLQRSLEKKAKSQPMDPQSAKELARQARSVEQLKRAYKELERSRNRINPDTRDGQRQIRELNNAMNETRNRINAITSAKEKFRNLFSGATAGASQLQDMITNAFSLYAIKNFVNKLVTVHSEFEMINKSLEILLHSSARAEVTWDRITKLALKSPFEIKQLATATKQMAAYRIESDQLYEKTKMLADISAGLGVEMSRLILAYGQVKAANFLRGTELRQFSEAGIDMLGQLATYFTDLEGRAVSAAEVFERISKRMVLFEDVDAVLTRITSRGGTFYKMQEEQSQTLRGQIRNLKDEVSLMFHEIGEQNHGVLTTMVSLIRSMVKNWRIWVPIITTVVSGLIAFKTTMLVLTTAVKAWTVAKYAASVVMSLFTKKTIVATAAVKRLSRAMNANPWMLVASAILAVVMALGSLFMSLSRTKGATQQSNISSIAEIFVEEQNAIEDATDSIVVYTKKLKELGYSEQEQIINGPELAAIYNARAAAISELTAVNAEYAASLITILKNEEDLEAFRSGERQKLGAKIEIAKVFGEEQDLVSTVSGYAAPTIVGLPLTNKLDKVWDELSPQIPPKFRDELYTALAEGEYEEAAAIADKIENHYKDAYKKLSGREVLKDFNIDTGDNFAADYFDELANNVVDKTLDRTVNRLLGDRKAIDKLTEESFGSWDKTIKSIASIGVTAGDYVDAAYAEALGFIVGGTTENVVGGIAHDWLGEEWVALSPDEYPQVIADLTGANDKLENFNDIIADAKNKYLEQYGLTNEYLEMIRTASETAGASPEDQEKWAKERSRVINTFTEILNEYDELEDGDRAVLEEAIGEAFGFDWSKSIQFKPWQDRYNTWWDKTIKDINAINGTAADKLKANLPRIRRDSQLAKDEIEAHENYIKELKEDISRYEQALALGVPEAYKLKADADMARLILPYAQSLYNFYGPEDKTKGKKDTKYKDILKAVDSIHKAYKTLEKDFDSASAKAGAWDKYGASLDTALKKVGKTRAEFEAQFGDLTSEESVTQAIEWLATQARDLDEKFDIQQHLGQWIWENKLKEEKEEFENAVKAIDEMFSGYELSIELDKLHIPKDFAEEFFDVTPLSFEELRKGVYDERAKFDGTDDAKKFEEYLKKIDELETKAQQERLKKYVEYSKAIVGDRAKILLDSFYELEDIEKTFVMTNSLAFNKGLIGEGTKMAMEMQGKNMSDLLNLSDADLASTWGFTQEQIDAIRAFNKELETQRDLAIEASSRKTQADLDTMDWKALKESDTFTLAMQDLERVSDKALEKMIGQITAYKSEWADMPYTEVKEMIEYINKLEDARMAYYKPDEAIEVARKEMESLGFTDTADAQIQMLDAETRIDELNEELSIVEEIERLKSEGATNEVLIAELNRQGVTDEAEIARLLKAESKDIKLNLKDEQKITSNASKFLKLQTKIIQKYEEKEQRIRDIKGCVDKVFEGWDAVNELFEDGSMSSEIAELTKGVSNSVFEALALVQGFKAAKEGIKDGGTEAEIFGYKLNMAMSIIGWIVMAIQLIAKGLKFAFDQHDKVLQEQIDAQVEKVEILKKEYEELEKSIEKAYLAADLGRYTREANKNLEQQIAATERMIALEEDKKKTDEDKIADWNDEIDDIRDQIEENLEEAFSTLTDGIIDDVLSTTRSFVDAWHDAYEETGNGMKGLEETFTDMLRNMLRQQASMQLISPFIDRYKEWLQEYVNSEGDNTLTTEEARVWAERVRDTFPEVNELLENFFEGTQGLLETGGELSDLEKGIQGMTEDQAEVLAAYWNSCRFMLSNIDTTLTRLANATLNADEASNPVVSALKEQTVMIRAIREMFSSVIDQGGSPHNGAYLKVYMP